MVIVSQRPKVSERDEVELAVLKTVWAMEGKDIAVSPTYKFKDVLVIA
jgi:hypothetical protein